MFYIAGSDYSLVLVKPLLERVEMEWQDFIAEPRPVEEADLFYRHEKTGLPLGSDDFLAMLDKGHI